MTQLSTWKTRSSDVKPFHSLRLSAVFGTPTRNCAGSGLCRLLPRAFSERSSLPCPAWPATLLWGYKKRVILFFEDQHSDLIAPNFPEGFFCLEAPFRFPLWLCKKLNLQSAEIPAGWYPVDCQCDRWILSLPVYFKAYQTSFM